MFLRAENETGHGTPFPPRACAETFRIRACPDPIGDRIPAVENQRDELVRVGKEDDPEPLEGWWQP